MHWCIKCNMHKTILFECPCYIFMYQYAKYVTVLQTQTHIYVCKWYLHWMHSIVLWFTLLHTCSDIRAMNVHYITYGSMPLWPMCLSVCCVLCIMWNRHIAYTHTPPIPINAPCAHSNYYNTQTGIENEQIVYNIPRRRTTFVSDSL